MVLLLALAGCGGDEEGGQGTAVFTAHVTDVESLFSVSPLPALAGGYDFEGRSYMTVKASYEGKMVPLYAPTAMTLYATKPYVPMGAPAGYLPDWALGFNATDERTLEIGFSHVKHVVQKIADANVAPLDGSSASQRTAPVRFSAGELFGYYVKGTSSFAWDFIVQDQKVENVFANQPRYKNSKLLHVICPFDRFVEPLQSQYLALLAGLGSPPPGNLACGSVARDKPGTAAGGWFLSADPSTGTHGHPAQGVYGSPFSAFKGEDGIVYIANLAGTTMRLSRDNPTAVDPAHVTTSHCYQKDALVGNPGGYAFVKLVSAAEMQVSYGASGPCPEAFPAGYETYYR